MAKIVDGCKRHRVIAGIHCTGSAHALKMIEKGFRFVTLASDNRLLAAKAAEEVGAVRKGRAKTRTLPAY